MILAKVWDVSLDELVAPVWSGHPQWLLDLAEQFEAEDRADRREEDRRRRRGEPEPKREITTFEGFADQRVRPREKKPKRRPKG